MNRILSLLVLLAFTTMAHAQSPYLPYNPDENADGLIGVADLQGLLSAYGNEFSSAILSDNGNIAVVEVGNMAYYRCRSTCASLPGAWSIVNENSVGLVIDEIGGTAFFDARHVSGSGAAYWYINSAGDSYNSIGASAGAERECFCATEQRPRLEYSHCSGGTPSEAAFNQCISEKLAEGWYPLSGFPNHHDIQAHDGSENGPTISTYYEHQTHASFWRWEQ